MRNRAKNEWFDRFDEFDIKASSKLLNNFVGNYIKQGYSDMEIEFRLDSLINYSKNVHKSTAWTDYGGFS